MFEFGFSFLEGFPSLETDKLPTKKIGSANTTFPFNFFSLYFNFLKCFTESHQRFLN